MDQLLLEQNQCIHWQLNSCIFCEFHCNLHIYKQWTQVSQLYNTCKKVRQYLYHEQLSTLVMIWHAENVLQQCKYHISYIHYFQFIRVQFGKKLRPSYTLEKPATIKFNISFTPVSSLKPYILEQLNHDFMPFYMNVKFLPHCKKERRENKCIQNISVLYHTIMQRSIIFQKSRNHPKFLCTRRMTYSKFHTTDPKH